MRYGVDGKVSERGARLGAIGRDHLSEFGHQFGWNDQLLGCVNLLPLKAKGIKVETNEERNARLNKLNKEREEELQRVPLQTIDKSKWPAGVRPISLAETGGIGHRF
jgi:hypothetical protein